MLVFIVRSFRFFLVVVVVDCRKPYKVRRFGMKEEFGKKEDGEAAEEKRERAKQKKDNHRFVRVV